MHADDKLKGIWRDHAAGRISDAKRKPQPRPPTAFDPSGKGIIHRGRSKAVHGPSTGLSAPRPAKGVRHGALSAARQERQGPAHAPGARLDAPDGAGQGVRRPITAKASPCFRRSYGASTTPEAGLCFPSYEKIAEAAGCARSTVYEAIKALEDGRADHWVTGSSAFGNGVGRLPGVGATRVRVFRTSNGYRLADPGNLLSPIFRLEPRTKVFSLFLQRWPRRRRRASEGEKRKNRACLDPLRRGSRTPNK